MYGVDLANTGHQPDARGPDGSGDDGVDVDWEFETDDSLAATPLLIDGTLYVGSHDERFYAIDPETGDEEWSVDLETSLRPTPAYADGNFYLSGNRELLSIDAESGDVRWREDGTNSNPYYPLVLDDSTGVVTDNEHLWRFDLETGTLEEPIDLLPDPYEMGVSEAPAISDGTAYVAYEDRLGAIDLGTGEREWVFENEAGEILHHISPAVADGLVYIGDVEGNFYAVDADSGDLEWEYEATTEIASSPSVANGTVFFGDRNRVIALETEAGDKKWDAEVPFPQNIPSLIANGIVYTSSHTYICAIRSRTGEKIWSHEFGSEIDDIREASNYAIRMTPIAFDGRIYLTNSNNRVLSIS
ncbi:outer membrane protein assembly factor BamB family protein [Natronobacterium haloterrestre]|nr:PQQ-binding-like beta-propeller repeat protein [Halobiforma haloterrestris]